MLDGIEGPEAFRLPKSLGLFSGTMLGIGLMIGSGIFSTPGIIYGYVGSVGMTITLFIFGAVVAYAGAWAFVEWGCVRPVSGGEKEYLDAAFPRAKGFFAFIFTHSRWFLIACGVSAADSVAFGQYMKFAVSGSNAHDYIVNLYATGCITFTTIVFIFFPRFGMILLDMFSMTKIATVLLIGLTGLIVVCGGVNVPPTNNFHDMFAHTGTSGNNYANALFAVFFAYDGWNNLNYALDELKEPKKNLPRATFIGVTVVSVLYLAAILSFFVVVPQEAIDPTSATIAAQFFALTYGSTFGDVVMPLLVAISCFGTVMCSAFGSSRVIFEAAKDGYFPTRTLSSFLGTQSRYHTPYGGLIIMFIVSLIMIWGPPPGEAYNFLVNLTSYPEWIFYGCTIIALLYHRWNNPDVERPVKSSHITNLIFFAACVFVSIAPFIPPAAGSSTDFVEYWGYPTIGVLWVIITMIWGYFQMIVFDASTTSINAQSKAAEQKRKLDVMTPVEQLSTLDVTGGETYTVAV